MVPIGETLTALAQGIPCADAQALAQRRAALEADLETLVRCALRNGTGSPGLVRWVNRTLPNVTGTRPGDRERERAAPVLARLLCRGMVNHYRAPRPGAAPAGLDTVADR